MIVLYVMLGILLLNIILWLQLKDNLIDYTSQSNYAIKVKTTSLNNRRYYVVRRVITFFWAYESDNGYVSSYILYYGSQIEAEAHIQKLIAAKIIENEKIINQYTIT